MTDQRTHRPARSPFLATAVTLGVAIAALIGMSGAAPERAEASPGNVPYHEIGPWRYDGYGLAAYPARVMRPYQNVTCRVGELVKWSPDLYRWNGTSWVLYDGRAPWYQAVTSIYGYCQPTTFAAAWSAPNGMSVLFHRFGALPPGYYAIKNYMYWASPNRSHADWSDVFLVSTSRKSAAKASASATKSGAPVAPAPTRANSETDRKAP